MRDKIKMIIPVLSSASLLVLNLLFFTPFNIYRFNLNEFSVPLLTILGAYIPALGLVLLLSAPAWILSQSIRQRYLSLLFMLGILTWLQGNFLLWEYGTLEGEGVDWAQNTWRGWVDGTIWVLLLIAALLFFKRIAPLAAPASTFLIAAQLAIVVFVSFKSPQVWKVVENELRPPESLLQFSSEKNAIHMIFDGFPSYALEALIEQRGAYYRESLDGFIFFREATGAFPSTFVSVPAYMAGAVYENDITMAEFLNATMGGKTILNAAFGSGYEVDIVDRSHQFYGRKGARYHNFYRLPVPYEQDQRRAELRNAALLLDLALFRSTPHQIKAKIYDNQLWLFQRWFNREAHESFVVFAHRAFLGDLINRMSIGRSKPVYKLMHFFHTHSPLVVDENGEFVGEPLPYTLENAMPQYSAAMDQFVEFLNGLKALGIYDSSLIILHSDHGQRHFRLPNMASAKDDLLGNVASAALPVVLIKPPHRQGPLELSDAPVALTDLPATVNSILGLKETFEGTSMLEVSADDERVRRFGDYHWISRYNNAQFIDWIEEYRIDGSPFERSSWQSVAIHRPGPSPPSTQSGLGDEPSPSPALTYSLDEEQGQLRASDGSAFAIVSDSIVGDIEISTHTSNVMLGGWAVDFQGGDVPEAIVIFNNGDYLLHGLADRRCATRECRAQVIESRTRFNNKDVGWAGFRFYLPISLSQDRYAAEIRVFGLSKAGVASELGYAKIGPKGP